MHSHEETTPHQDPHECSAGVGCVDRHRKAHPQLIQTQRWTDLWANWGEGTSSGLIVKMRRVLSLQMLMLVPSLSVGSFSQNAAPMYNSTSSQTVLKSGKDSDVLLRSRHYSSSIVTLKIALDSLNECGNWKMGVHDLNEWIKPKIKAICTAGICKSG